MFPNVKIERKWNEEKKTIEKTLKFISKYTDDICFVFILTIVKL